MNNTTLVAIANTVLSAAGASLVANGTFTQQGWQQIVGAIITVGSAVAAHFAHKATSTPNA